MCHVNRLSCVSGFYKTYPPSFMVFADPFWKSGQEINYAVIAGFHNIAEKLK